MMSIRQKEHRDTVLQLQEANSTIEELRQIINLQKREIERLKLSRGSKIAIKSNLDYLDQYPIKGLWHRGISGGAAGTI